MKRDDWYTLFGGALLVAFGYWDTDWRMFWFAAGGVMFCWAFVTSTGIVRRQ